MRGKIKITGKTYLSNKGYSISKEGNEDVIEKLKDDLTVSPRTFNMMDDAEPIYFPLYRENAKKLYIPRFYGLQKFGVPNVNQLGEGEDASGLIFNGSIRENQKEPIEKFLDAIKTPTKMGGIISVPPGYGKTVMGLYIASIIKKKTLVVCHKDFLSNQWKERIEQYLPKAKIGKIKQKIVDVEDKDIVMGSLQSIAMKDYDSNIFKQFGFVIMDECHHTSSEVFSRCLPKITTRYMCGLSATLNRKDGLRRVFEWFIGKPVYSLKNKGDELNVIVKRFYDPHPEYGRELKMWNKKLNVAKMINKICEFPPRNYMIINTLFQLLEDEPDRQVIILSERRTHLNIFEDLLKIHNISENDIGYYVGGMKQTDLDISSTKKFILATNQQASEGMDIPTLNTLILSSPVSSIEQAIGRIQRQKKEERIYTPTVIDIIDEFSLFERQGNKRLSFYKNNNYTILDKKKELEDLNKNIKHQFMIDSDEEN